MSVEHANTELEDVARALAQTYPENIDSTAFAVPLQQDSGSQRQDVVPAPAGGGVLILLIACANVAGLLKTRGANAIVNLRFAPTHRRQSNPVVASAAR